MAALNGAALSFEFDLGDDVDNVDDEEDEVVEEEEKEIISSTSFKTLALSNLSARSHAIIAEV